MHRDDDVGDVDVSDVDDDVDEDGESRTGDQTWKNNVQFLFDFVKKWMNHLERCRQLFIRERFLFVLLSKVFFCFQEDDAALLVSQLSFGIRK